MACEKVHHVKRNDTGRAWSAHLELDGVSVDLAGGGADIVVRTKSGTVLASSPMTILQTGDDQTRADPNVQWYPDDGDLDHVGRVDVEIDAELASGRRLRFPQQGYYQVQIHATLTEWPTASSSSSS